ncbi:cGMP-dependent protein kinase 2 isoform X3 [Stegostoma tigrinum]|uniref:cGMP-dependent protein kinase 2 isoform X3 n=1 Tax=Stegostoma tigrinum TaxID=3053191 RepID=UPI00286FB9C5|nr:cGMP-dependent protein kinase 2 isoform X3 [Stegostoma tigrinum]
MGNGFVKSKQLREPESHAANLSIDSIKISRDNGSSSTVKATAEILKDRLLELELENKSKDDKLQEKECRIQDLEKQIIRQTRTIAEITEQLQAKCIQLNKLQDVVKTQCGVLLQSSPSPLRTTNRIMNQCTGLFKDIGSRRKGAKEGVSAEPTTRTYDSNKLPEFSLERARVRKDSGVKKLITEAFNKNQFLKRLETQQIRDMVECMYEKNYQHGDCVIKQGEPGNHLYVLAEGKLEVVQNNKILTSISIWTAFGELAILYNCTRTASVKALSSVKTWVLDQDVFRNIMRGTAQARHDQYRNFLRSVSLLKNLPEDKLTKIVDCLEVEYYDKGDYIIREGEEGSTFFILAKGKVKVTQSTEYHIEPQLIKVLQRGDYFGEKALISDDVRSANIIADENNVECLVIDRETFNQTVGTFDELQNYLQGYVAELTRDDEKRHARISTHAQGGEISLEMIRLKEKVATFSSTSPFRSLEIITTLGVGGFGRVELVKMKNEDVTFAVKCIKKKHIVDTRQQEHIHSEKKILEEACSPFIVSPPFSGFDQMMTYNLILKGIEKLDFPKKITKRPEEIIRRLCKQNPTERLGNLKNGINDIKKHRWFSGFNWEGLKARTLPSPLKRELKGPTDYRYFDKYPPDKDIPPDELSGWDKDF